MFTVKKKNSENDKGKHLSRLLFPNYKTSLKHQIVQPYGISLGHTKKKNLTQNIQYDHLISLTIQWGQEIDNIT